MTVNAGGKITAAEVEQEYNQLTGKEQADQANQSTT